MKSMSYCITENCIDTKLEQVIDPRRIEKYVKTVYLQLKVAELICKNAICVSRSFESVPTVFGVDKERLDLILLIFDASDSLTDAFELTLK